MAARPSKWSPNALPSKVASSAKLLATASRSRRFAASNALPISSTRSGVVDSSGIVREVSSTGIVPTMDLPVARRDTEPALSVARRRREVHPQPYNRAELRALRAPLDERWPKLSPNQADLWLLRVKDGSPYARVER